MKHQFAHHRTRGIHDKRARGNLPLVSHPYEPAPLEQYLLVDNAIALGYGRAGQKHKFMPYGCDFWKDNHSAMYTPAQTFVLELKNYSDKILSFEPIPDLRTLFSDDESNRNEVCKQAELDPDHGVLEGFFNTSRQLSYSSSGNIEPLFPPMRHPNVFALILRFT